MHTVCSPDLGVLSNTGLQLRARLCRAPLASIGSDPDTRIPRCTAAEGILVLCLPVLPVTVALL